MNFTGTIFNDTIVGTTSDDVFDMSQGGNDTVSGGDGNDTFKFGATFDSGDVVNGGNGNDTLNLAGDYSALHTFGPANLISVETVTVGADHNYFLQDTYLGAGLTLVVNAAVLSSGNWLNFESPNSDGRFAVLGGAGNDIIDTGKGDDVIYGGAGNDSIQPGSGANTVNGGDGNDVIAFFAPAAFSTASAIDGGAGFDQVYISGDYSAGLTFGAATMVNVEDLNLTGGTFVLTMSDSSVVAGLSLTVDASSLTSSQILSLNAAAETNGAYIVYGGAGADRLIGGAGNDQFTGGGGADRMMGGAGGNMFVYNAVSDSTSTVYDHITDFNAATNLFNMPGAVTGVDPLVAAGTLNSGTFDAGLASAIGAGQLLSAHAVLFTPDAGNLSGHEFLVVDANGVAGYQAGQDYVIEVTGLSGALTAGNFV